MAQASAAVRQQRDLIEEALDRGAWQASCEKSPKDLERGSKTIF